MLEPVRWGVLGVANIATGKVIPGMEQYEGAMLHAIASRTLTKAEAAAAKFGGCKAYGSYDDLLADPEIEAVYIPLPNGLHAKWSIKAMRAGKDVLCEKPIAMDAAEAREIQAVRDETGQVCLEAFAYRFNPAVAKAIEICRTGQLGPICLIHTNLSFPIVQEASNVRLIPGIGGGCLWDMGCYSLNLQRMLAGREPKAVYCKLDWSDKWGVDMAGAGVLDFGDGLWGTIDFSFLAQRHDAFKALGPKGGIVAPYGWVPPAGKPGLVLSVGAEKTEIEVPAGYDYGLEVQDLSEHIRGVREARYLHEPLDATMRLVDACFRSDKASTMVEV